MQAIAQSLPGVFEIQPKRHGDHRGYFAETLRCDWFREQCGYNVDFLQENESLSVARGTIRGIHFQADPAAQGKLVRCTVGRIFDVAVDLRHGSTTFGKWLGVELSAEQGNQLWIPVGFGHAFCTLEPACVVSYKVTHYYSAEHDAGVRWNDPDIAIAWPETANLDTLSEKDMQLPFLAELPAPFMIKD